METDLPKLTPPNKLLSKAVQTYLTTGHEQTIKVWLNQLQDTPYQASYFLRSYDQMPAYERLALDLCQGEILDIGAGAGPHTNYLLSKNKNVTSLESDPGFCQILKKTHNTNIISTDFFNFETSLKYDTILLLMNGLGIAQTTDRLPIMIDKLVHLLAPRGKIILELTEYEKSPEYNQKTMSNPEVIFRLLYDGSFSHEFLWLYPSLAMIKAQCSRLKLKNHILFSEQETMLLEIKK